MKLWLKCKLGIFLSQLKLKMGNTCGCSEESLAVERNNELDCSNIFGYGPDMSVIEPTKEKTANE